MHGVDLYFHVFERISKQTRSQFTGCIGERSRIMEGILTSQMTVPLYQIMFLLVIVTVSLLFGYLRLGLFFVYAFVFYWGNMLNLQTIFNNTEPDVSTFSFMFVGFGLIIIFLAMIGFLLNRE